MNAEYSQLLDLQVSEKLELVEALWDSIAATPDELPVTDWQKEELARRKAAFVEVPDSGISWEEAKERILRGSGGLG
jgi:putative addiction module component (TIGR02574 family)